MSEKTKTMVRGWSMPNRTEERVPVTSRLDFSTYAKLHALKAAFPKRSVNEIINDILRTGLDEVIESLGEPRGSSEEFIEEHGMMVDIDENQAFTFEQSYRIIMERGKDSETTEGEEK